MPKSFIDLELEVEDEMERAMDEAIKWMIKCAKNAMDDAERRFDDTSAWYKKLCIMSRSELEKEAMARHFDDCGKGPSQINPEYSMTTRR